MKLALITTTIRVPTLLGEYVNQARGHDVQFIVAGDLKTPLEARTFCEGLGVEYLGQKEQEAFLEPYSELSGYLPWNSVQRRNVAILKAYKDGADVIITIDDDNFVLTGNYFDCFSEVGDTHNILATASQDGWVNCYEKLENDRGNIFYPRGYPLKQRTKNGDWESILQMTEIDQIKRIVSTGFVFGDPDIDAITRLSCPPTVVDVEETYELSPGSWCPFNSQNTALHRDVIPAYFLSPHIGRYDDIWSSYIVQRLAQDNNGYIYYGFPLVEQKRNPHNLFNDLDLERFGMEHTDDFCEQLRAATITKKGYKDGCLELLDQIKGSQYEEFIRGYRIWLSLF